MTDAWFSSHAAPYFSLLSLLSLCSIFEVWGRQGRHRRLVESIWNVVIGSAVLFFVGAAIAFFEGQPAHVTNTLALVGSVVGFCFVATRGQVSRWYQDAELRRTIATDL